jgi:hypothetical protein
MGLLLLCGCSQSAKDDLADVAQSCGVSTKDLRKAQEFARSSPVGRKIYVGNCWTEKARNGEVLIVASLDTAGNNQEAA